MRARQPHPKNRYTFEYRGKPPRTIVLDATSFEQLLRSADCESRFFLTDLGGVQPILGIEKVQFRTVQPPSRFTSAVRGDLPFAVAIWKRRNVDFVPS